MSPVVLLVDDDRLVLKALSESLRLGGFTVVAESDAQRASEILVERNDVFALVSDFQMPVVNGVQLARAAKQRNPTMLVLIVSSADDPAMECAPWDKWIRKDSSTTTAVVQELRRYHLSQTLQDGVPHGRYRIEAVPDGLRDDDFNEA